MPKKKPEPYTPPPKDVVDAIYDETRAVLRARPTMFGGGGSCPKCGTPRMHYACFVAGPWNRFSPNGTAFVMHTIYACQTCHPMFEGREWTADDGG